MATTRISTAADGTQGNGISGGPFGDEPSFSPDGTRVAFTSSATNLVANDTIGFDDSFVKTISGPNAGSIVRVSTAADGAQSNGASGDGLRVSPVFSPDGTQVAFNSSASNLVAGDTNNAVDLFVKTLSGPGAGEIMRVSTAGDGTQGNADAGFLSPVFSPDGTRIAFASFASNLVAGDTNSTDDVFLKTIKGPGAGAITRVSVAADGTQADGGNNFVGAFSPDGTRIVFESDASNLVAGDGPTRDIFVKDLGPGGAVTRVSASSDGTPGNDFSDDAAFSPNGTQVAFRSAASNLVAGDTNANTDIFLKTVFGPGAGSIVRVSTTATGAQADFGGGTPEFSPDGTRIAFASGSSNLVPGDTNGRSDIFLKTISGPDAGAILRVSTATNGAQAVGGASQNPMFSPSGTQLAFTSEATNLVGGDTNSAQDVFVTDIPCFASGTLVRTSRGEVAVESLAVGDEAVTASGRRRRIIWLGHRRVDCRRHPRPDAVWPVRIEAEAFGPGLPARDLWLSPDHSVAVTCLREVLVPIKCLLNGTTIVQVAQDEVTYWHVELDGHDILLAESLPAESYLDTGNRTSFGGGGEPVSLHPVFDGHEAAGFCRPVHLDGPVVEAVRVRLHARAQAVTSPAGSMVLAA